MTYEEFQAEIHARWPEAVTRDDSDSAPRALARYYAYQGGVDVLYRDWSVWPWVCSVPGGPCESGTTLDDALAAVRAAVRAALFRRRNDIDAALAVLDGEPGDGREGTNDETPATPRG